MLSLTNSYLFKIKNLTRTYGQKIMQISVSQLHLVCMGVPRGGGETGICPPEIGTKNKNLKKKLKLAAQFRLNWINCCNHSLFGVVTLTLRKSHVHHSGVMQWWACSPLMSTPLPAEASSETC